MRISDWSSDVCSSDLFLRLRFAHHFDHLGQRRIGGKASDGDFDRSRTVDGAGEYAMLSGNLVRLGCRLGSVRHRLLIDGDAFACHGGLVDARLPEHDEPVGCQLLLGLYDYGLANVAFLDGNLAQTPVPPTNHGRARRTYTTS